MATSVDVLVDLGVERRDIRWLKRNGIKTVEVLASMDPVELCKLPGFKSAPLGYCRNVVEKARAFLEMVKSRELIKRMWIQLPRLSNVVEKLLEKPLLILASAVFGDAITGEVLGHCVKLYVYSLETRSFETIAEKCYEGVEEADKDFEESAKMLKQRLGNLVCVHSVDGDCFKYFG